MQTGEHTQDFVPAGLASLGIEADEIELAVMQAAHSMFWPSIRDLLSMDLGDLQAERNPDLSRAPEEGAT
ncbi:MAG TPA: hypothetical protein VF245_05655 [Solirubrobacterales bacterium]